MLPWPWAPAPGTALPSANWSASISLPQPCVLWAWALQKLKKKEACVHIFIIPEPGIDRPSANVKRMNHHATINLTCQLGWGKPRELTQHDFWVCPWECFWKRLTVESVDWGRQLYPPQCRRAASKPRRAQIEQKSRGRANPFSLPELGLLSSPAMDMGEHGSSQFPGLQTLGPAPAPPLAGPLPVLRPLHLDWMTPPAFLFSRL